MKNVKKLFLNNIKLILIYCFLIIALLQYFSVPYNIYSLLKRPYEERMTREYGYCEKEGYGYTKFIMNKYNLNEMLLRMRPPRPSGCNVQRVRALPVIRQPLGEAFRAHSTHFHIQS